MTDKRRSPALFWFYILVAYIFLQFGWWTYLMLDLNKDNTRLKTEITLLKSTSLDETHKAEIKLNETLNKKRVMVIGEGVVFIILLLLGIVQTRNSFKKEAALVQQQNNFLLSVTHELKSPIASNRLQLETLLLRDLDREKQKQILENAIQDIDRLNALVENILLSAQLDQSRFSLVKEQVNVSVLVEEIVQRSFRNSHCQLDLEKNISFQVDKMYFTSIVLNLIDNALKYSPAKASVQISLRKHNNTIVFSVADNGIGIAPSERQSIFQKFYRIGKEETRHAKGTGLGLYIVKSLVELHGAEITVKANTPTGTIFEISFLA